MYSVPSLWNVLRHPHRAVSVTRYMMLIDGVDEVYMIDRDNAVYHVPRLWFPKRKDLNSHLRNTLTDGVGWLTATMS